KEEFVRHLAEAYSLSSRLVRNRRAVVGGLAPRRLVRHDVQPTPQEEAFRARFWEALAADDIRRDEEKVAQLLKRLGSSPRSAAMALEELGHRELARQAAALEGSSTHAKSQALLDVLRQIQKEEPGAKVLVFTESRETLDYVRELLARHGWDACI